MQHMFHTEIIDKANYQQNKPHKFDKTNLHLAQMKKKIAEPASETQPATNNQPKLAA